MLQVLPLYCDFIIRCVMFGLSESSDAGDFASLSSFPAGMSVVNLMKNAKQKMEPYGELVESRRR